MKQLQARITAAYITITNYANVVFDAELETSIDYNFQVDLGSTLEIK